MAIDMCLRARERQRCQCRIGRADRRPGAGCYDITGDGYDLDAEEAELRRIVLGCHNPLTRDDMMPYTTALKEFTESNVVLRIDTQWTARLGNIGVPKVSFTGEEA